MTCTSHQNIISFVKSRRIRWAWLVARRGRGEVHTRFWWGKPDGKRPLVRRRRTWEDNIKTDFQEIL
jgi:hypothetical protein